VVVSLVAMLHRISTLNCTCTACPSSVPLDQEIFNLPTLFALLVSLGESNRVGLRRLYRRTSPFTYPGLASFSNRDARCLPSGMFFPRGLGRC